MCGILGEFVMGGTLTDRLVFEKLTAMSLKRGPDGLGYLSNERSFQFGFNRLAILDLTPQGMQPMQSQSGRYTVVFNGEIYNHLELRNAIIDSQTISSSSDTATLCAALDQWGVVATIHRLDGMFAIGIYDAVEDRLILVRDFAGIKPLFFGFDQHRVVFASQYDQVVSHPAFRDKTYDERVLKLYLQQHFMPAPHGLVRDTGQLLPGEIVSFDREGLISRQRYWELPDDDEQQLTDTEDVLDFLHDELSSSVKAELLSDVPLGAFLSGGIDSPLVTYYSQLHSNSLLKAFTIGSDSKVHDERLIAARYASMIGVDHMCEVMDGSMTASGMDSIMASMHEPLGDISLIPTYWVSQLARRHVTVALSGDGGDELFFGYDRFWSIGKNIKFQRLPYLLRRLTYMSDRLLFNSRHVNGVLLSARQGDAHRKMHSRFPLPLLQQTAPELASVLCPTDHDPYQYDNTTDELTLVKRLRKAEFYGMMQKTLRKVDLASMENSLEVRVPILKKTFIEASLKVPPVLSYGRGRKKDILKKLVLRNLPLAPVDDIKRGFLVPLAQWMGKDLRAYLYDTLQSDVLTTFGLSKAAITAMLDKHCSGTGNYKWPLFTLLALVKWKGRIG